MQGHNSLHGRSILTYFEINFGLKKASKAFAIKHIFVLPETQYSINFFVWTVGKRKLCF